MDKKYNIGFGKKQAEALLIAVKIALPKIQEKIDNSERGTGELLYWVGIQHKLLEIKEKLEKFLGE